MQNKRWLLSALCLFIFNAPAWAASSPEAAPKEFFEAVYKLDYITAWKSLSPHSQEQILSMLVAEEQQKESREALSQAQLKELLEKGDVSLRRGFWTRMRQAMGIEIWVKQNYQVVANTESPEGSRFVQSQPGKVTLFVAQNEPNDWRFGFIESFVEKLRPTTPKSPSPSPTPKPTPSPKPTPNS